MGYFQSNVDFGMMVFSVIDDANFGDLQTFRKSSNKGTRNDHKIP